MDRNSSLCTTKKMMTMMTMTGEKAPATCLEEKDELPTEADR